jgi:hypothetical protein
METVIILQPLISIGMRLADHKFRGEKCKHIFAVEISYAIRETVRQEVVIQQITAKSCPQCKSLNLVKTWNT